jgi:hypothetical protein
MSKELRESQDAVHQIVKNWSQEMETIVKFWAQEKVMLNLFF